VAAAAHTPPHALSLHAALPIFPTPLPALGSPRPYRAAGGLPSPARSGPPAVARRTPGRGPGSDAGRPYCPYRTVWSWRSFLTLQIGRAHVAWKGSDRAPTYPAALT